MPEGSEASEASAGVPEEPWTGLRVGKAWGRGCLDRGGTKAAGAGGQSQGKARPALVLEERKKIPSKFVAMDSGEANVYMFSMNGDGDLVDA